MNFHFRYLRAYLKALFKLVRWPNLILVLLTQYIVFAFIVKNRETEISSFLPSIAFFILSVGTLFIAAAGYIINDYYDIKIDLVNKPGRIVIGRIITRRQALLIHSILNFSAIGLGLFLSWKVALYFAACAFLLWLYSNYLKRTPLIGNIIVSLLTSATIWIISLYYRENDKLIYIYSLFAFFISLLREVIKDIEDTKGDATYGCKTLPILIGVRKTKIFLYGVLILFAVLFLNHFKSFHGLNYILLILLLYLGFKLFWADKQKDYTELSLFCKWFMLAGALSLGFV
ncbi:MAG: geranylgeranylglycerol-phosphate geranylgeranyltransferase [Opitutaceae bacterium]|nr:geranylgeranylglycerol-phosphate geranylgeranyltransferase [Cytophagales bacterium]